MEPIKEINNKKGKASKGKGKPVPVDQLAHVNGYLKEFLSSFNETFQSSIEYSFVSKEDLLAFATQIQTKQSEFLKCRHNEFKDVPLFQLLDMGSKDLTPKNETVIWEYLHGLYLFTVSQEHREYVTFNSKAGIQQLSQQVSIEPKPIESANNFSDFFNVINDVAQSFMGNNTELAKLFQPSTSTASTEGSSDKTETPQIDFMAVMDSVTGIIQNKINSGEINTDKLKEQAEKIHGSMDGSNPIASILSGFMGNDASGLMQLASSLMGGQSDTPKKKQKSMKPTTASQRRKMKRNAEAADK